MSDIKRYICTSTNYNPLYYEFLPTVYKSWKIHMPECKFVLAFIDDRNDKSDNKFIERLKEFCDELIIFNTINNISSGILAKISRMWLCSLYGNNICTNVDIDSYLLNLDWFKNITKDANNNKFITTARNMYNLTPHKGKWQMSLTTAKSFIWKKIINPNNYNFDNWIKWNCNLKNLIDNKEPINIPFNSFSDESLLRYYVVKHPDKEFIVRTVQHMDREDCVSNWSILRCLKRVDRSYWGDFSIKLLNEGYYIDSNPLRPFNKNKEKIKPILKFIGLNINNINYL